MKQFLMLIICIGLLFACSGHAGSEPSTLAKGMPGAEGTIEFAPADRLAGDTTWWKDTDGVDPGAAGCHVGTNSDGAPNGRMFGEACLPNGLLVESNPGAGVVHKHEGDLGHPDTFDCNRWCEGNGAGGGSCEVAVAPPCASSAKCVCN